MPYRRSGSYRRRSGSRNYRSRSRLRNPGATGRWEASEFNVTSLITLPTISTETKKSYIHLASITLSLAGPAASPNNVGVALGAMSRKLLIGGVVMDHGVDLMGPFIPAVDQREPVQSTLGIMQALVSDRMVTQSSANVPNSITSWDPFQTEFPTTSISSNTNPSFSLNEGIRPTRIHYQRTEVVNLGQRALPLDESEPASLQLAGSQYVRQRNPTVNKRLKLVLSDEYSLFACTWYHGYAGWALSSEIWGEARAWFRGTLYWRYVF